LSSASAYKIQKDPRVERNKLYLLIEVIAIDGKTERGSCNARQGSKAVRLVGARAAKNRWCLPGSLLRFALKNV
jgi:hypothetical protein